MKKLILSFLILICLVQVGLAEDTILGTFQLTERQMTQSEALKSDVIKGFCLWGDGKLVVTSTRPLSELEKSDLIASVQALPDEDTPEMLLLKFNPDLAIGREAQVFSAVDMVRFALIGYNINELIRFKNFWGGVTEAGVPYVGLKQFCQAAVAAGSGMFTQADYDKLNGILKEQGIDLDAQ